MQKYNVEVKKFIEVQRNPLPMYKLVCGSVNWQMPALGGCNLCFDNF